MDAQDCSKSVFVTVGTTLFDALIEAVDQSAVLQRLAVLGYSTVIMQTGKGCYEPAQGKRDGGIDIQSYKFKPTLAADMAAADLIISHAGAGSIMEALKLGKPLITVVNAALMDNHQCEIAEAMASRGYALATTPQQLLDVLQRDSIAGLIKYPPPPDPTAFVTELNLEMAS